MPISIKSIDEISDLEKLSLVDFSYSRIDTYKSCPSKYFYTYIQKEPRGFAEAATLRKYSSFCFRNMYRARN
jgi:hypothetical protein